MCEADGDFHLHQMIIEMLQQFEVIVKIFFNFVDNDY